jgi:hypothetical protein
MLFNPNHLLILRDFLKKTIIDTTRHYHLFTIKDAKP